MEVVVQLASYFFLFGVLMAFLAAFVSWVALGYAAAFRKGYRRPGASCVLVTSGLGGVALIVLQRPPTDSLGIRFLFEFFIAPLLYAIVLTAVIVVVLPKRAPARRFGVRRPWFPFTRTGQVIIVFTLALVVVDLFMQLRGPFDASELFRVLSFAALVIPLGQYLMSLGGRLDENVETSERMVRYAEHPVLYLRAFAKEREFFVIGSGSYYYELATGWAVAIARERGQNVGVTFEAFFADAVADLGPFVALGSPEDLLAPEGATRLYATDADWKTQFDELARRAICILVEAGASTSLGWELEHIHREGLAAKLFVITRPATTQRKGSEPTWSQRLSWWLYAAMWRLQGRPLGSLDEFTRVAGELGYRFDGVDDVPGAVIAFETHGAAVILTRDAERPQDFVEPILEWIAQQGRSGDRG